MRNSLPPSGRWKGYYLYGDAGLKHHMSLHLTFAINGRIDGEGIDDVGAFVITGRFDSVSSQASWVKAYTGMHDVQYAGLYCRPSICGDWTLGPLSGGFWIWPSSLSADEFSEAVVELELEVQTR